MRTIYLTLGFFMLLGIGAACRTPPLVADDCTTDPRGVECRAAAPQDRD
ncbi:MAG: hypothetical protein QNJ91_04480 [Gammaproteobacteria bacterium]|nr:hypothetical protein [Gammaproteobacteria bacterium]